MKCFHRHNRQSFMNHITLNRDDKVEMTKNRLSYYSLYLKKYLQEVGHPQKDDDEFITMRADAAAEEGEKSARQGLPPALAEEQAMTVLLEGLENA